MMKIAVATFPEGTAAKRMAAELTRLGIGGHEFVSFDVPGPADRPASSAVLAELEKSGADLLMTLGDNDPVEVGEELVRALPDNDAPTALVAGRPRHGVDDASPLPVPLPLQLLTGERLEGAFDNFRLYPTVLLAAMSKKIGRDDYGKGFPLVEILIDAASAGYSLISVELDMGDIRRSASASNVPPSRWFLSRIFKALLPIPRKRLCPRNFQREKFMELLLHPKKFIKYLLMENASPGGLAAAAAVGMFLGTVPMPGLHTIAIIYVSVMLRLNKMMSVNISHLCVPPFVPLACVWIGHFVLTGAWPDMDIPKLMAELKHPAGILLDWFVGAAVLAPTNAAVFAALTFAIASGIKKSRSNKLRAC